MILGREFWAEEPASTKIRIEEQRRHVEGTDRILVWPCSLDKKCAMASNCNGKTLKGLARERYQLSAVGCYSGCCLGTGSRETSCSGSGRRWWGCDWAGENGRSHQTGNILHWTDSTCRGGVRKRVSPLLRTELITDGNTCFTLLACSRRARVVPLAGSQPGPSLAAVCPWAIAVLLSLRAQLCAASFHHRLPHTEHSGHLCSAYIYWAHPTKPQQRLWFSRALEVGELVTTAVSRPSLHLDCYQARPKAPLER